MKIKLTAQFITTHFHLQYFLPHIFQLYRTEVARTHTAPVHIFLYLPQHSTHNHASQTTQINMFAYDDDRIFF